MYIIREKIILIPGRGSKIRDPTEEELDTDSILCLLKGGGGGGGGVDHDFNL